MIDVREMNEVQLERVPLERVLNHPMSVIMERLPYIAKDQNIIVACPGGIRSVKVARLLQIQGYPHVASLDGGFSTWIAKGMPFDSNVSLGGSNCNPVKLTNADETSQQKAPFKNSFRITDYKNLRRI